MLSGEMDTIDVIEVQLENNNTVVLTESDRNIANFLPALLSVPVLLRDEESQQFWSSAEDNVHVLLSICRIFEKKTRQILQELQAKKATTSDKNAVLHLLCQCGGLRLKLNASSENKPIDGGNVTCIKTEQSWNQVDPDPTPMEEPPPDDKHWIASDASGIIHEAAEKTTEPEECNQESLISVNVQDDGIVNFTRLENSNEVPSTSTGQTYILKKTKPFETVKFPFKRKKLTDGVRSQLKKRVDVKSGAAFAHNTCRRNIWAARVFHAWANTFNKVARSKKLQEITGSLEELTDREIVQWVSKFITDVRKSNGKEYPARSLQSLFKGLQGYVHMIRGKETLTSQPEYTSLKQTLEAEVRRLNEKGIGLSQKHGDEDFPNVMLSQEQEEKLWKKGILGDRDPTTLLRTMVYLNRKHFGLKGGMAHRNLRMKPSQITLHENTDDGTSYLMYIDDTTSDTTEEQGEIICHENTKCPERCHVRLFKKYTSLCPKWKEFTGVMPFYLHPEKYYSDTSWFSLRPVGPSALQVMLTDILPKMNSGVTSNPAKRKT